MKTERIAVSRKLKIEKSKKKVKVRLFTGAREIFNTNILKGAHIELFSNRELSVEGCCGVYEYTDCYIRLNLGNGSLILSGENFDIDSFDEHIIIIRGNISSMEFCVADGRE